MDKIPFFVAFFLFSWSFTQGYFCLFPIFFACWSSQIYLRNRSWRVLFFFSITPFFVTHCFVQLVCPQKQQLTPFFVQFVKDCWSVLSTTTRCNLLLQLTTTRIGVTPGILKSSLFRMPGLTPRCGLFQSPIRRKTLVHTCRNIRSTTLSSLSRSLTMFRTWK